MTTCCKAGLPNLNRSSPLPKVGGLGRSLNPAPTHEQPKGRCPRVGAEEKGFMIEGLWLVKYHRGPVENGEVWLIGDGCLIESHSDIIASDVNQDFARTTGINPLGRSCKGIRLDASHHFTFRTLGFEPGLDLAVNFAYLCAWALVRNFFETARFPRRVI